MNLGRLAAVLALVALIAGVAGAERSTAVAPAATRIITARVRIEQWPAPPATYAHSPLRHEVTALRAALSAYCHVPRDFGSGRLTRSKCSVGKAWLGLERSKAPHGRDIRGWAITSGDETSWCSDGCAVVAVLRRSSIRPLRYRVVSFMGPTGGGAGSCFVLYWGGKHYPTGPREPPAEKWRRLPGAVVWAFRPLCALEPGRTVNDFYR